MWKKAESPVKSLRGFKKFRQRVSRSKVLTIHRNDKACKIAPGHALKSIKKTTTTKFSGIQLLITLCIVGRNDVDDIWQNLSVFMQKKKINKKIKNCYFKVIFRAI